MIQVNPPVTCALQPQTLSPAILMVELSACTAKQKAALACNYDINFNSWLQTVCHEASANGVIYNALVP